MASIENSHNSLSSDLFQPLDTGVKVLADASNLKAVPSKFNYANESSGLATDSLPVVDLSAVANTADPDQRSRALQGLAKACQEWGFFIKISVCHINMDSAPLGVYRVKEPLVNPSVTTYILQWILSPTNPIYFTDDPNCPSVNLVNHGLPEELMKAVYTSSREFFNLPDDEKKQYEAKCASDPINCGISNVTTTSNQTFTLWRDYLKLFVHPEFHCPSKPQLLRSVLLEYTEKIRKLTRELVEAVSETLELEKHYSDQALNLDSSFQIFAANFYPPCPEPDQAIGLPPHTDPGLFTFLIHNGVAGLQIEHDGKWFNVESPQNSILVNAGDQLQIFSNGRFKSVKHRAVVNSERERISLVVANGPSGEAIVGPAAPLVEKDGRPLYRPMKYTEYLDSQMTKTRFGGKSMLEQMMILDD